MAKKKEVKKESNELELKATPIFFRNMNSEADVVVNRGSAGSSKSHSICQLLVYKFLTEKNKKILIIRKSLPSLRISVLWLLYRIFDDFGVRTRIHEEKVGLNYYFGTNLIHLGSVDDPEKIKSTEWNYIWMEEATELTYDEYLIVRGRLRAPTYDGIPNKLYLSFNPVDEFHWIRTELLEKHLDVEEIHSIFKDNPFLPIEAIKFYEAAQEYDMNYYRVYALGEWGRLDNLIYSMWDTVKSMPTSGDEIYGLDFGFNSETALIHCIINGMEVTEEELIYRPGLTNSDLIAELKVLIPSNKRNRPIYADSAEPDRIKEIRLAGFNIKPAQKSIADGIDFVKRFKIHILESSASLQKEKKAYSWKKDKLGHVIDEPIPLMDHLMDGERYAIYTHLRGIGSYEVRWL